MKLDLSCPIEVRGYTLTYAENEVRASVRLNNLSQYRVASFDAVVKWKNSESGKRIVRPFCAERLYISGEESFRISLFCEQLPDADALELLFTCVRFDNGTPDWCSGEGPFVEMEPLPSIGREDLEQLRRIAGADAVCYPQQDTQTWRCVCGRINANSHVKCARCHRDHFSAIGFTSENVRFRDERIRQSMIHALDNAPELSPANLVKKRSQLMRRSLVLAVAVLAITVTLVIKGTDSDFQILNMGARGFQTLFP